MDGSGYIQADVLLFFADNNKCHNAIMKSFFWARYIFIYVYLVSYLLATIKKNKAFSMITPIYYLIVDILVVWKNHWKLFTNFKHRSFKINHSNNIVINKTVLIRYLLPTHRISANDFIVAGYLDWTLSHIYLCTYICTCTFFDYIILCRYAYRYI